MALSIDLAGRVALVTGVSSGIGAGVARRLAQAGAHVAGCGSSANDDPKALGFLNDVRTTGARGLYKQADVESPDELNRWSKRPLSSSASSTSSFQTRDAMSSRGRRCAMRRTGSKTST